MKAYGILMTLLVSSLAMAQHAKIAQSIAMLVDWIPAKLMATPADKETDVHRADRAEWMNANLIGKQLRVDGLIGNMHPKDDGITVQMTSNQSVGKRDFSGHLYAAIASDQRGKLDKAKAGDRLEVIGEIGKVSMIRTRSGNRDFVSMNLELKNSRVVQLRHNR